MSNPIKPFGIEGQGMHYLSSIHVILNKYVTVQYVYDSKTNYWKEHKS